MIRKKILTYPLKLALSIFLIGSLFTTMHWPGSYEILLLGSALVTILYTFRFFDKKDKDAIDVVKFIWVIAFTYFYTAQTLYWPSLEYGNYAVKIIALYWLYEEGPKVLKKGKTRLSKLIYSTFISISIFSLILGNLFKIMHWPNANILIILGYFGFVTWLLTGDFILKTIPKKQNSYSDVIDDEMITNK